MPKKRATRLYWKRDRAYADFRDYASVGGRLEPLIPAGQHFATKDPDVAAILIASRLKELDALRRGLGIGGVLEQSANRPGLAEYVERHLELKRDEGTSPRHLQMVVGYLRAAVEHFGADRDLQAIAPRQVNEWLKRLRKRPGRRGQPLTNATTRKYLNALSDLYARAVSDQLVDHNPARDLYSKSKPRPERRRARYWEPDQVAALLESVRTLPHPEPVSGRGGGGQVRADAYPWIYPLIATAALTGARKSELFGLEVDDVSFRYNVIFVRPNEWRDLKTDSSDRRVPLWPQLEAILRAYIAEREQSGGIGSLLFPSHRHDDERMLDNIDKQLDTVGARVSIERPRLHTFRHSYTAARIQTLEHGAPVSLWQVARELGHQSTSMIEKRYGHLAKVTERKEVVEFRQDEEQRPALTRA